MTVSRRWDGVIRSELAQRGVQIERASPPRVEIDLASPYSPKPLLPELGRATGESGNRLQQETLDELTGQNRLYDVTALPEALVSH